MFSTMKKMFRNRLLMMVLALALTWFGLAAISVPVSHACPPQTIEYTYYLDEQKTQPCGWKTITCSCGVYSGGCATEFYTIDWSEC